MVSILDGGPLYRLVDVGSKDAPMSVQLWGIKFKDLVPMLDRFPELRRALTPGRDGEVNKDDFSLEGLVKMGPRIVNAIIAAAMGFPGDEKKEKFVEDLSIGVQVAMMKDIIEMTFPKGLGPFVDDLRAMGLLGKAEEEQIEPVKPNGSGDKHHSGARGKEAVMNSLSQSESSPERTTTL